MVPDRQLLTLSVTVAVAYHLQHSWGSTWVNHHKSRRARLLAAYCCGRHVLVVMARALHSGHQHSVRDAIYFSVQTQPATCAHLNTTAECGLKLQAAGGKSWLKKSACIEQASKAYEGWGVGVGLARSHYSYCTAHTTCQVELHTG